LDENQAFWCDDYFVFGGLQSLGAAEDNIGEIFKDGSFDAVAWNVSPENEKGNVVFPDCIRSKDDYYLTGGTGVYDEPPGTYPQRLLVSNEQVSAMALDNAGGLPQALRVHSASTAMNDGSILVTGGIDDDGNPVGTAYIAKGNSIVKTFEMAVPRFGHTATLITKGPLEGSVLIAGGFTIRDGQLHLVEGAEIFHPGN
jgi:hypothetical protein